MTRFSLPAVDVETALDTEALQRLSKYGRITAIVPAEIAGGPKPTIRFELDNGLIVEDQPTSGLFGVQYDRFMAWPGETLTLIDDYRETPGFDEDTAADLFEVLDGARVAVLIAWNAAARATARQVADVMKALFVS